MKIELEAIKRALPPILRTFRSIVPHQEGSSHSPISRSRPTFTGSQTGRRHELMELGYTGRYNPELDTLNRRLTDSLSNEEIARRIRERDDEGKPTGQLRAAARRRGIDY